LQKGTKYETEIWSTAIRLSAPAKGTFKEAIVPKSLSFLYTLSMAGILAGLTVSMSGQSKPKGEIDLVGYAHTDLSWLWPRSETIHEVLPLTIESVLNRSASSV